MLGRGPLVRTFAPIFIERRFGRISIFFGYFMTVYYFIVHKMCYRFPSIASKLPLQKGHERSGSLLSPTLSPKSDHWDGFVRTFSQFTKHISDERTYW